MNAASPIKKMMRNYRVFNDDNFDKTEMFSELSRGNGVTCALGDNIYSVSPLRYGQVRIEVASPEGYVSMLLIGPLSDKIRFPKHNKDGRWVIKWEGVSMIYVTDPRVEVDVVTISTLWKILIPRITNLYLYGLLWVNYKRIPVKKEHLSDELIPYNRSFRVTAAHFIKKFLVVLYTLDEDKYNASKLA